MITKSIIPIQSIIIQHTGSESLPMSILEPKKIQPFLREIEKFTIENNLEPLIVYWSNDNAKKLLPKNEDFLHLQEKANYLGVFSNNNKDSLDEWSFLVESLGLCLVVNGLEISEASNTYKYECIGSLNPDIVDKVFTRLASNLEEIDQAEFNKLLDARKDMHFRGTNHIHIPTIKSYWPKIQSQIIQNADSDLNTPNLSTNQNLQTETVEANNAIQPIVIDSISNQEFLVNMNEKFTKALTAIPESLINKPVNINAPVKPSLPPAKASKPLIFPDLNGPISDKAQTLYKQILQDLKQNEDFQVVLTSAMESLTKALNADRGLLWLIEDENTSVTCEYSVNEQNCFANIPIPADESYRFMKEILSYYQDDNNNDVAVNIPDLKDVQKENRLYKNCGTIHSLFELGDVRGVLIAKLHSRNKVLGFLELHQCTIARHWGDDDCQTIISVAKMISVVLKQAEDQKNISERASEMELLKDIAEKFRKSRNNNNNNNTTNTISECVNMVAKNFGFSKAQIYLHDQEENCLKGQIPNNSLAEIPLSNTDNPFITVFKSEKAKFFNIESNFRKQDLIFEHKIAWLIPLKAEGTTLGVLGLWDLDERRNIYSVMSKQKQTVGENISDNFASVIRADQAITLIEAHQRRTDLINSVSREIKEFNKTLNQADAIRQNLSIVSQSTIKTLQEYFELKSCMLTIHGTDKNSLNQTKIVYEPALKTTEEIEQTFETELTAIYKFLINIYLTDLRQGKPILLNSHDLQSLGIPNQVPFTFEFLKIVPLVHEEFKGSLFMIFNQKSLNKLDSEMMFDIADRLASAVSNAQTFIDKDKQATTDPMTGLYNRRHFNEKLAAEINRFHRSGRYFSFIIVDLDFLKKINDNLGHQFGDLAIIRISDVIKKCIRDDVDVAGRFGGEEFTILLPETDYQGALTVAQRICESIRAEPIEGIGIVTASLGLAVFPNDANDSDALFEAADKALYLAKKRGRNRVCSAAESYDIEVLQSEPTPAPDKTSEKLILQNDININLKYFAEEGIIGLCTKIIEMVDQLDSYGTERTPRAYDYALKMAKALRLSDEHAKIIALATSLCNLGKLGIPETVLNKTGPLTEEEIKLVRTSPTIGAKLLEPAKLLHKVAVIIQYFRENYDGSGYPNGIKGDEIPVEARIVSIVDSFTAMTSDRPYRKSLTPEEACNILSTGSGTEFDPRLVKIFLSILQRENKTNA